MNNAKKTTATDVKIKVMKDGPYELDPSIAMDIASVVANEKGESISWAHGRSYAPPEDGSPVHLCRCGHSKNKPYCDGAHVAHHFDGTETASNKPYDQAAKRYRGEAVDIYDQEELCAVARFCDVGQSAWGYAEASGSEENKEAAIRECGNCPSGRLTIVERDGTHLEPELAQRVSPINDSAENIRGPLWVQGGIPVESADGEAYELRNRVTLCRCGESKNKPFCDGRHLRCEHMRGQDE